jgi:hypothetical protein
VYTLTVESHELWHTCLRLVSDACDPSAEYPDLGCNTEVFTNADMLELETLSPLTTLPPDGALEHTERWSLHRVGAYVDDEDALLETLAYALRD